MLNTLSLYAVIASKFFTFLANSDVRHLTLCAPAGLNTYATPTLLLLEYYLNLCP